MSTLYFHWKCKQLIIIQIFRLIKVHWQKYVCFQDWLRCIWQDLYFCATTVMIQVFLILVRFCHSRLSQSRTRKQGCGIKSLINTKCGFAVKNFPGKHLKQQIQPVDNSYNNHNFSAQVNFSVPWENIYAPWQYL